MNEETPIGSDHPTPNVEQPYDDNAEDEFGLYHPTAVPTNFYDEGKVNHLTATGGNHTTVVPGKSIRRSYQSPEEYDDGLDESLLEE